MNKKIASELALGIIILVAIIIGAIFFLSGKDEPIDANVSTANIPPKVENLNKNNQQYKDRSLENPIDANYDLNEHESWKRQDPIKYNFALAKRGEASDSSDDCKEFKGGIGFCVGGYAGNQNDQSICETYNFESLYMMYPMCMEECGMTRGFAGGNSQFENCYIGYGIINKDEKNCDNMPEAQSDKNIPKYEDDKTPAQQIKKESCLYGVAIGKNNYEICESAGFFRDTCYRDFAELRKSAEICHKINNGDFKSMCIRMAAPLSGEVEQCMNIEPQKYESGPVAYSNVKKEPYQETNEETKDRDMCIFDVVDEQKLSDKTICEKIVSPYYKYLCRQRVAMNLKDPSLCTIDFLASQGNVDGCIYTLAKELRDLSLCQRSSDIARCTSLYNGEPVSTRLVF